MFFNRNYIPAVPIREEQRLSEEEELARQLKREASIFFPDSKLPDFSTRDLPSLPVYIWLPQLACVVIVFCVAMPLLREWWKNRRDQQL